MHDALAADCDEDILRVLLQYMERGVLAADNRLDVLDQVYNRFRLSQEQDDGGAASYNTRFEGNPGTGKTTIARHYGTFLQQLSVLPSKSIFEETSGAKLIQDGVKGLK